jgi:tRNA(Ile)-lysidine synthase TilS/MesJ
VVETIFINLARGAGIKGLKGIPEKQGTLLGLY